MNFRQTLKHDDRFGSMDIAASVRRTFAAAARTATRAMPLLSRQPDRHPIVTDRRRRRLA
ncbi:hypothetical protein G3N18_05520 [Microbacterium sp. 2C]|nr:hypothetical protein [Microbacterium paulum]